ncbi:hypothetical protein [Nonomuraea jiangxiensis]|nr:hypothetical protein [Nonomuraea jiangxiensis]
MTGHQPGLPRPGDIGPASPRLRDVLRCEDVRVLLAAPGLPSVTSTAP